MSRRIPLLGNQGSGAQQDFQRYEFKYLLNAPLREVVETEVRHFMRYDGHVHRDLDNAYYVRSLYFDDPWSSAFYEKTDGIMERRKFRIRTYGLDWTPSLPIFLEVKGRTNERTYKHRIAVPYDQLDLLTTPNRCWELTGNRKESSLFDSFIYETERRNISPRVLVDYLRRPYVSDYDANFRLTFDSGVKACISRSLFPIRENVNWLEAVAGWTILEVKFDRRMPKWFHRILQNFELRRVSISKFCVGMKQCGIAEDLS